MSKMNERFGFAGRVLRVDLCTKSIKKERLDKSVALAFLGGKGYGSYLVFTEIKKETDPLGPLNKLIFDRSKRIPEKLEIEHIRMDLAAVSFWRAHLLQNAGYSLSHVAGTLKT
jgi:hypothetical protein